MDAFTKAAGINASSLAYLAIAVLASTVIIALIIGLNNTLLSLRANRISPNDFLNRVLQSIATILITIAFIYFLYKENL